MTSPSRPADRPLGRDPAARLMFHLAHTEAASGMAEAPTTVIFYRPEQPRRNLTRWFLALPVARRQRRGCACAAAARA